MRVQVKKLTETAVLPVRGSVQAAGYDLCADIETPLAIAPGETAKVGTGLAFALPEGYFGGIYARSGLSTKKGVRPANCTGVVDSDYRGPVIVALHNDSAVAQTIEPGERIAQLIVQPYLAVEFEEADTLDETARGEGGFGSTGTK
ncbi:MAG: dUTP diphosphatase [Roseburia sp.]